MEQTRTALLLAFIATAGAIGLIFNAAAQPVEDGPPTQPPESRQSDTPSMGLKISNGNPEFHDSLLGPLNIYAAGRFRDWSRGGPRLTYRLAALAAPYPLPDDDDKEIVGPVFSDYWTQPAGVDSEGRDVDVLSLDLPPGTRTVLVGLLTRDMGMHKPLSGPEEFDLDLNGPMISSRTFRVTVR